MAGSIIISKDNIFAISTVQFDYLEQRIRGGFRPGEEKVFSEIYDALDEGAMMFISTREQDSIGFKVFVDAVRRAHEISRHEDCFSRFELLWEQFLVKIDEDDRAH